MDFEYFRNAITSPAVKAVVAHWDEARGTALMPSWDQLRPARMAPYLSILWAFKYDRATDRFSGRLAGNKIAGGFEKNFRGLPLQEMWPADLAARCHLLNSRIISEPVIYRKVGALFKQGEGIFEGERVILPLASDGINGDGTLGVSILRHPRRISTRDPAEIIVEPAEWFSVRSGSPCAAAQAG